MFNFLKIFYTGFCFCKQKQFYSFLSDLDTTDFFFYCFISLARTFGMCWIGMVKAFGSLLSITLTIDFSYLPFIKLRKFLLILWVFIMIGRWICRWPFLHLVIIINHVGKLVLYALIWWKWKLLSHVWLFATLWTIQSMEFSRPEYWSG